MNIARNSFIIFSTRFLLIVIEFFVSVILAWTLGAAGVGLFFLFLATVGLVVSLGGFGFGSTVFFFLNREKKDISELFSNALVFGVFWGISLAALAFLLATVFPELIASSLRPYLFFGFLIIPLHILIISLLPIFLARFEVFWWSFASLFYGVILLLGVVLSVTLLRVGMAGVFFTVLLSSILTFILVFSVLLKKYALKPHLNLGLLKEQVRFGVRSYLGDIFLVIHPKLNLLVASFFMGVISVGHLAIAFNVANLLFLIPFSLQQVLTPTWSALHERQVDKDTPQVARRALLVGVGAALGMFFLGPYFILFFFGSEFLPALPPLFYLLPGVVFMVFASIFFNNFFSRGKPHLTSLILLGTLALNVVLYMFLVPGLGVVGIALSASIAYLFAAIAALMVFSKLSGQSILEIVRIRSSDFSPFRALIPRLFHSGKLLQVTPDLTLAKLKEFYEEKAQYEKDVVLATFESPSVVKRLFYVSRANTIMSFLNLDSKDTVLEIGCGVGYYTKKIAEITKNLVATDIAEGFVRKVKAENKIPIQDYVVCSVEDIPFKDNSFDKVLISEVIEHLIDPEKGIQEIYRVLKPGGKAVIATPNRTSYLNFLYHLRVTVSGSKYDCDHIKEFSQKELRALLGKYFAISRFRYINYFPLYVPKFLVNIFGFDKVARFVAKMEAIINAVPVLNRAGFSQVFEVTKYDNK